MNAFACHHDPVEAARALADAHVVKMTLETAQVLCTVAHERGLSAPYKATHARHPVVRTAAEDVGYRSWLAAHGLALAQEYRWRFQREHGSEAPLRAVVALLDARTAAPSLAAAPCAMPEPLRGPDVPAAYRRYLREKYASWGPQARWTRRFPPVWLYETPEASLEVVRGDDPVDRNGERARNGGGGADPGDLRALPDGARLGRADDGAAVRGRRRAGPRAGGPGGLDLAA